jgi:hypothetical protein
MLRLLVNAGEVRAAMAHFHHAHAAAMPIEHFCGGLFKNLLRERGGAGGKVVGAFQDYLSTG